MKTRLAYCLTLFLALLSCGASAQYIQVNDTYTAQQLVQYVLVNSPCASVSNFSVSGAGYANNQQSYGYFNGAGTTFPFQNGVVLSTGRAKLAQGPNTSLLDDGGNMNWQGDADLETALNINNSVNATVLEFDFIPLANKVSFDYMLSSEEYHDTAPCTYSDGFAFLLKEVGSTDPYQNLAVIPGTQTPVKVTSVHPYIPGGCPAQNEQYFGAFNGSEHPTNFNGQTKVLKAQAHVTPGVQYHIKLVIADEGNYRYDSAIFLGGGSFDVTTDLGPDRLRATNNPLCSGEVLQLDAGYPQAASYQWYKNGAALSGENGSTYNVTTEGDYSVAIQLGGGCDITGEITIQYAAPPVCVTRTLLQCDDDTDGLTVFNLTLADELLTGGDPYLTTQYYETMAGAQNGGDTIQALTTFANTTPSQDIYARVYNPYGCYSISTVTLATSANTVTNPDPIESCDLDGTEDGFYPVDLTQRDADILQNLPANLQLNYYLTLADALEAVNPIPNPSAFTTAAPGGQTVYARIFNGAECYGIAELEVVIYTFGENFDNDTLYICDGQPIVLDAGHGYASYLWDTDPAKATQRITVTEPGTYTVTVTNDFGCEGSRSFTVLPSGRATGADFDINDFNGGDSNSITVLPEGEGDFEYSLNGLFYQDSSTF